MSNIAVLDIGKTNVKLSAVTRGGVILETLSAVSGSLPGPPYRHLDLNGTEDWLFEQLPALARRHSIAAIVACCHGSAGVLVDEDGPVVPMMDYDERVPDPVNGAYRQAAGPIEERGSPFMPAAAHLGRQLFWIESEWPGEAVRARWMLGGPQYWAWRLSGIAASEVTYLAAQSQLWNVPGRRFTRIVEERGWRRLLPDIRPAWASLGRLKPEIARRLSISADMEVLCGIHDSSANFYRYQAAGLTNLAVVSTGTWVVGLSDSFAPDALSGEGGLTWNATAEGAPLTGILAMGGREFASIAGDAPDRPAEPGTVARLIEAGTMALPSFGNDHGPFPGSAGRGRIVGPPPATPGERRALALLYVALLTDACLDRMGAEGTTVLDGTFVKDPLYAALVAGLRPGRHTLFSADAYGTAAGAALLADHERRSGPAAAALEAPAALRLTALDVYRRRWRALAEGAANAIEIPA